ncbi:MAG: DEAD/DEAH box helicase [Methermicoccaceae archaeon]
MEKDGKIKDKPTTLAPEFGKLPTCVRDALIELGFTEPTDAQKLAIPEILAGKHVLLLAPTGSGKTEGAMLPIFSKLVERKRDINAQSDEGKSAEKSRRKGIRAIYITPLRALNRDMLRRMEWWGQRLGLSIEVRHGDTPASARRKQALNPPDILITTPETMQLLFTGRRLREHLKTVDYVVLDEVHELAYSKRGLQLSVALERLVEFAGEFQRIGLSATVGNPEEVAGFVGGTERTVKVLDADSNRNIRFTVMCPKISGRQRKLAKALKTSEEVAGVLDEMANIIESHASTLIFVNTRSTAEVIGSQLKLMNLPVEVHHGSLSKEVRMKVEDAFKAGKLRALICTSSMELGIDIGSIEHVIQYNSPRRLSRALQRVGRSGHSLKDMPEGTLIASDFDEILECCTVARLANRGVVEAEKIREKPWDVLANQLCAHAMLGKFVLGDFHTIVSRAYPFRALTYDELLTIATELVEVGLILLDGDYVVGRRRTRRYFYDNISMIPDERKYRIKDVVSNSILGTLDEAFVVSGASPGATFITKGEMWRVVLVENDDATILVEPVVGPAQPPNWVGEELTVSFQLAQEVGKVRRKLYDALASENVKNSDSIKKIVSELHTDSYTIKKVLSVIKGQYEGDFILPDDKTILIEHHIGEEENYIVVNACFGDRVNETLGRYISAMLSYRAGTSIGVEVDPYRIRLTVPLGIGVDDVMRTLKSASSSYVGPVLEMSLRNTNLFRWRFTRVAKRFGIFSSDVDWSKVNIRRLFDAYRGTLVYEEAFNEVFSEDLDVDGTIQVLEALEKGDIKIMVGRASPIGAAGFLSRRDILLNERAEASVLKVFKERILSQKVILLCLSCRTFSQKTRVGAVDEKPTCPVCGSMMIAALKPGDKSVQLIKKGKGENSLRGKSTRELTADERKRIDSVKRNANIVMSYGKRAVIALSARGIGPETAARILNRQRENEMDFYRDILWAEREYARTKRFWD